MKLKPLTLLTVLIFGFAIAAGPSGSIKGSDLLVTTDWLAKHLNDENLVLLHAHWTRGSYRKAHIPGARFLWLNALAKDTPDRNTELPSKHDGAAVLKDLGITNQSRIVVYFEGGNMTMSTRMILTLTYFGLGDRVSLLDGGFEAWKSEKRPVTKEIPKVKPGTYVPTIHPEVVADAQWVRAHETDPNVTIIDARAQRFYDGKAGSPPGHIPHAVSVPFSSVADTTNRMLDLETLRQVFVKAGVKPGNKIVTYCHVGQQATLVYFAAKCLGYDARVYDGSFEDWSDQELPVDNPSDKK
jgi:thiosulfate/3-mercaptopyruvate sulfurtransferase